MNSPWWTTPRRVIQPILTVEDGDIDAAAMVEELHDMGCDTILQNVGGMVAWYPTGIAHHVEPARMEGDVLGTVIEAAAKHGMRVLGRFDFSGLREEAFQAHPSWFYIGVDGRPMMDKGFYATCMSGAYLEEFVIPLVREVTSRYRLDGAFFNMFGYRTADRRGVFHGPCHCEACRKKYSAYSGGPLPGSLPHSHPDTVLYQGFSGSRFLDTLKRLDGLFKEKNPEFAMLIGNGSRSPSILLQGVGETTEVELHWTAPNPKRIAPAPQTGWRYMTGDTCRQVRTMEGFGSMVNLYTCGGGRLTAHSRNFAAMGIAQTIANGGGPFIAFTGKPWAWDSKHREAVSSFYSFMRDNADCFRGLRSEARIVLVNSHRDLGLPEGREDFLMEFRGFYGTLVRAHQEFDVVDIAQLERTGADRLLSRYRLAMVPNARHIPGAASAALERFVSGGGRLLATGESGRYDGEGGTAWSLGEVLGVEEADCVRPYVENAFFRGAERFLPDTKLLSVNGRVVYAKYSHDAEKLLPMTGEIEYASPELECVPPENGRYGLVLHRHGGGKSAFLPWELGKLIHAYGQEDHISLLEAVTDLLLEEPRPFVTDAPPQVEITLHRQESGRLVLQLVNETGQDGIEMRAPVPIRDITVGVRAPANAKAAARFGKAGILPCEERDGYLTMTLPELGLYQLITIDA